MNLSMPPAFPQDTFQEFGKGASKLFPAFTSDEVVKDPLLQRQHFEQAWMAVRYRYRACSECNEEFKALLVNASDLWREWATAGEEQNYKIEKTLYQFFMSGLSVFESLGLCLYFVGSRICPAHFPFVKDPKHINLKATSKAFTAAFPNMQIASRLAKLSQDTKSQDPEFSKIGEIRNILAHRLIGRRNVHGYMTIHFDGTFTDRKENFWRIPGSDADLIYDEGLIQRHFDEVTRLLTALISASLQFVESVSLPASP